MTATEPGVANTAPLYHFLPDKDEVRRSFDRVAAGYDEVAVLQRVVGQRLVERLLEVRVTPDRVLDVGAGTGSGTAALAERYPEALVVAVDIAPAMLRQARQRAYGWASSLAAWGRGRALLQRMVSVLRRNSGGQRFVCADADALPFAHESVALVHSNLTLQWCQDLERTFGVVRRVLRPEGLLVFTTFGPDTLKELRAAWRTVDDYSHVNAFLDMHDVGDALTRAGFSGIVMDVERITLTYPDVAGLMRDLKALGAHNVTHGRPRGLTGRGHLKQLVTAYETFRHGGRLPATYEVIYGHAWVATPATQRPVMPATVPVAEIKRANVLRKDGD